MSPLDRRPAERRLTRDGMPVELTARYMDALVLMAEHPGELITKDRFMAEVWRGVPVTDEALTQCIRTLRRTLGDEAAAPSFIETVPRHGYRFIAEVEGFGRQTPVPAAPHRTDYGAWRMAGGGVMGACGRNAAEEILRDIG